MKNSAAAFLALSIAAFAPAVAAAEDAESARTAAAFLTLCPAALTFDDLERALSEAEAAGRVTRDPEGLIFIVSHQAFSQRRTVVWEGQELELGWGAGPACGVLNVWTSDYNDFSDALSARTGVAWEERSGIFLEARRQQVRTYRHWVIERAGQRFEITSLLASYPAEAASTQGFISVSIGPVTQSTP